MGLRPDLGRVPDPSLPVREVVVCVQRGGDLAPVWLAGQVAPPSAGVAAAVLDAADRGDGAGLRDAALAWLPPRMASDVRALSDGALAGVLVPLVARTSGVEPTGRGGPSGSGTRPTAPARSFSAVLVSLAAHLSMTPAAVRAMPWPDALALLAELAGAAQEPDAGPVHYGDNAAVWEGKGMTKAEHDQARAEALAAYTAARQADCDG